jgi:hypothetical protein
LATPGPQAFLHNQPVPAIGGQYPRRVGQFRKVDFAPARPRACRCRDDEQFVVEQMFDGEVFFKLEFAKRPHQPRHDHVELALAQLWEFELCAERVHLRNVKNGAWMLFCQLLDDGRKQRAGQGFRAADPNLAGGGICQRVDLAYGLTQIIKGHLAVSEQSLAVKRWRDTAGAAVEQSLSDGGFQIRHSLRHHGLGNAELSGGLACSCCPIGRRRRARADPVGGSCGQCGAPSQFHSP